ncbi:MAG TPA: hypothetical protein PKX75_21075, partial [Nitrospira sp.]|nr:hypothetical protein [Nitrospira sp.]
EKAARLRDEGEQRLADLEQVSADAWPWAPWMYAVRETDMVVPENGGAPVYEGLRLTRPRVGAPDQLDFLEFGRIVPGDDGDKIGLRAAGSPSWQLVSYAGTLNGSPIAAAELPREGGPMWPDDDDSRTAAAIERKIGEVFRYGKFEALGWRGASDAWLEKWWPRFADAITTGLAGSFHREQAPVVDAEGLAIAAGDELRGVTLLPPTRAGWQRFLELAPKSGESYSTLKEIGLSWWGRKIPQNLLAEAKREREAEEEETGDEATTTSTPTEGDRLRKGAAIEAAEHPEFPPAVTEQIAADHLRTDPAHYDQAPAPEATPDAPPDIIQLSAAARARRAQAEAEEVARIERIAGDDTGLRDLALQLGELADPIEKSPREIADWFDAKGYGRLADQIHEYLDEGGPFGGLLEELAELLRESNEDDVVGADADGLTVPIDAIEKDGSREYVVRQEPEGLARRYIGRLGPVLDEDGEESAFVHVRDVDLVGSEGERLKKGDPLVNFQVTRFNEAELRERWHHFQMLAKALRRAPQEIERARQLLVYAAVLVRAPKCMGTARAAAKRALSIAIREHQAAAAALVASPGEAAERLARVARHLARTAREVAQSCADGQVLLADPEFSVPKDIPEEQDKPTPFEESLEDYRDITTTALQAIAPKPDPAATRTIEAALQKTLRG